MPMTVVIFVLSFLYKKIHVSGNISTKINDILFKNIKIDNIKSLLRLNSKNLFFKISYIKKKNKK